jgi:hypothetical protein
MQSGNAATGLPHQLTPERIHQVILSMPTADASTSRFSNDIKTLLGRIIESTRPETMIGHVNGMDLVLMVARGGISLGKIRLESPIFPRFGVTWLPRRLPIWLSAEET